MTADELRPLLQNAGVRPLTVYANGKALRIAHPEFAALSPNGETLIVFHKDNAAFDVLDVALIGRVLVHEPAPPKRTRR